MLSENIVACLLPGTSFGGCLVSRSRFSAEILPGFFAECRKLFVLAGLSSVFVSNGASWKIMLLFIGINSAITSCFSDLSEYRKRFQNDAVRGCRHDLDAVVIPDQGIF